MGRDTNHRLRAYVLVVAGGGTLLLAWLLFTRGLETFRAADQVYWLLALLVLLGELRPIQVRRGDEGGEINTAPAFSVALLFAAGLPGAVFAQVVGSLVADGLARKPPVRALFNVGQYVLALAAGGAVLDVFAGAGWNTPAPGIQTGDLPAVLTAGVMFFVVNNALTATAIALDQRISPVAVLREDFALHLSIEGVLLALSPVVVVVAQSSLPLIALLLVAVAGLYRSAERSRRNEHQAQHDLLTDLPNRRLFDHRLDEALRHAKRGRGRAAVMLVDLDRFKEINDTLGHHVGDGVLQAVGPRLETVLRSVDTIARLGGDEFAVLLPDVGDAETAEHVARRLCAALERPIVVDGFPLEVRASVGVALYPDHGEQASMLLQRADVAMYTAKKAGGGAELFAPERHNDAHGRLSLLADLRVALDEGDQLEVHYQPIADLRTGRVRAVEALVRWNHPQLGHLAPEMFVPLSEQTELISPLTHAVLDAALATLKDLHAAGHMVAASVNLAVANLYDNAFPREVDQLLTRWRIAPAWLELEITEGTVMADPARAQVVLAELAAMGVKLAIDDFGTGYSSLVALKQLPVNQIKIDRSFIIDMATDGDDGVIVRSIVELARNLGLRVVAEGVETEAVCTWLGNLGCDLAQGFLLSRPLPNAELLEWLEAAAEDGEVVPGPRPAPPRTAAGEPVLDVVGTDGTIVPRRRSRRTG